MLKARKNFSSCYIYIIKSNERNKRAEIYDLSSSAACTVFESKIVVTGGSSRSESSRLKSVEPYDYHDNKWTYLPDMKDKRSSHVAVSMGNKLFVIGGYRISSCEVFDTCSRKFTIIKLEMKVSAIEKSCFRALCIGSSIVVFHHPESKSVVYMYDVNESKWSTVELFYTKNYFVQSLMKYYVQ